MDSPHSSSKLDLYSIPVFLLEVVILIGLAFSAHYLHFQHKHEPYLTGFYCDDISLRHEYRESKLTEQFTRPDNELVILSLLLVVPIVMIIFCELINSMFGSLKFRKIRALCKCCKLHSITRRTIRFSGAYLLGFLIVMISCDILASTTGKLKPYFAQECPNAFKQCPILQQHQQQQHNGGFNQPSITLTPPLPPPSPITNLSEMQLNQLSGGGGGGSSSLLPTSAPASSVSPEDIAPAAGLRPLSQPISSSSSSGDPSSPGGGIAVNPMPQASRLTRTRRDTTSMVDKRLLERQWIMLEGVDLARLCAFAGDEIQTRKFEQLAMSWPSFPAAIVTYACLFLVSYLCFVGTARPVRIITSVLVVVLFLNLVIFDVQLVREHYSHWEDSLSGAVLAAIVVIFVLFVYLNKFKDAHYYENQKLNPYNKTRRGQYGGNQDGNNNNNNLNMSNGYSNEIALEQYSLDKQDDDDESPTGRANNIQTGGGGQHTDNGGSVPNNDLAMRYFQIPRANYRGAPRPLSNSTNNHM